MFPVRVEYITPVHPASIEYVANIPATGDHAIFGDDDASFYVQSVTYVLSPNPGHPVAIIRLNEELRAAP